MKRNHCLRVTVVAFFLSLSSFGILLAGLGEDGQDPWLPDLHPPRLALSTSPLLSLFPALFPSKAFVQSHVDRPAIRPLPADVGRSVASPREVLPLSSQEESGASRKGVFMREIEGLYLGRYAPKPKKILKISGKSKIQKQVEEAAMEIGVDPRLAKAMAAVESGYDQRAVSPRGAIGVLQLMPRFFCKDTEITPEMLYDPDVNIRVGLTYFRSLLDKFNDNIELSLAAYNAGVKRVVEAGHVIPPLEQTQNYVRKVKEAMEREDLDQS